MITIQPLVVGIFQDRAQAGQAINELHQVGFDNRHIRFARQGNSTGGILGRIKSIFTRQDIDMSAGGIYNYLVNMGMPPEEARYYQSELGAGRSIVAVLRTGAPLVATSILTRNGGSCRNEYIPPCTDTQEPPTEDVKAEPNGANGRIDQSTDSGKSTSIQEPPREDVKAEPNSVDGRVAESTDHGESIGIQEPTKDELKCVTS